MSIYEISAKLQNGEDFSFSHFKNKVLLIMNTAPKCPHTNQYKGYQELYEKFIDKDFEILDFPCNQFFSLAPGSDSQIHYYTKQHFHTTFLQFAKVDVNGKDAHPLFKFLKKQKPGRITWNFTKFLVDKNGDVVARFAPKTTADEIYEIISNLVS